MKYIILFSAMSMATTTYGMECADTLGKKAYQLATQPIDVIAFEGLEGEIRLFANGNKEQIRESMCSILSAVRVNDGYLDKDKPPVVVDFKKIKLMQLPPEEPKEKVTPLEQKLKMNALLVGLGFALGFLLKPKSLLL